MASYFVEGSAKLQAQARPMSNHEIEQPATPPDNTDEPRAKTYELDSFSQEVLDTALAIAQRIPDPIDKIEALIDIAGTYWARFNQPQQAKDTLQQAVATARTIPNLALRAKTLADIAGSYQTIKPVPNPIRDLLAEALQLVTVIEQDSPEKEEALRQIAFRYALEGDNAGVRKVLRQITNSFTRTVYKDSALETTIDALVEAGKHEKVFQLIQISKFSTLDEGLLTEEDLKNVPPQVRKAIQAISQGRGDPGDVVDRPSKFMGLAKKYHQLQQFQNRDRAIALALQNLNSIQSPSLKRSVQISLAQQLVELKQNEQALNLLNQVEQSFLTSQGAEGEDNFAENDQLGSLANGLAKLGQMERATQIARKIPYKPDEFSVKDSTLTGLARIANEQGNPKTAIALTDEALALIQQKPTSSEKIQSLAGIAGLYYEFGATQKVQPILNQVMAVSPELREEAAGYLFILFQELEQLDQAFAVAKAAGNEEDLVTLAAGFAEKQRYEQAIQMAQSIPSVESRADALAEIAVQYTRQGQIAKGFELMQQAIALALTAKSPDTDASDREYQDIFLQSVLKTYMQTGDEAKIFELAKLIPDSARRTEILYAVFTSYEVQQAETSATVDLAPRIAIAKAVSDPKKQREGLMFVAFQYSNRKQFDQTLELAQQIPTSSEKVRVLTDLAWDYAANGQPPTPEMAEALNKLKRSL